MITKAPDFAEAWNKRATLYYQLGEYRKSLADCEEVIKRNPVHFGALAGFGLIYVELGDLDKALEFFERAVSVNPNLYQIRATIEAIKRKIRRGRLDHET